MSEGHGDASAAMIAPFEPEVPCREMETRPCVNIPSDPEDLKGWSATQSTRYRFEECEDVCVRFQTRKAQD